MNQVIVQHFQLDRIPQALPRATEDPVHKLASQLTEGGLNALAHLAEYEPMGGHLVARDQQHLGLLGQASGALWAAITQLSEEHPAPNVFNQCQDRFAIIPIAGGQDDIEHLSADMPQPVQFKAKEPPFARFAKVRAFVPQQPYPPVPDGLTEGNRLTVPQV